MKKHAKQWLALFLAVCSLVTFAMPTVFAAGKSTEVADQAVTQNVEIPEPVVYEFYRTDWANKPVRGEAAGIKEAYDAGTLNWRYEAANSAYQFRPGGSNEFLSAFQSLQYYTSTSNSKSTRNRRMGKSLWQVCRSYGIVFRTSC